MSTLLAVAVSFPSAVYTVLLAVVLVYWGFVVLGAAHIDLLGGGEGGGADGLGIDQGGIGVDHGGIGVDHGGADVSVDHGGAPDGGDGADGDAGEGGLAGLLSALHLRRVPLTVVVSLVVIFSWLCSVLAMEAILAYAPGIASIGASVVVLALSLLVSLPVTSIVARPLGPLFTPRSARGNDDLVGKVCVVRTGSVDAQFGEATLEDGGAGLVVRVRVQGEAELRRGDKALIVAWDREKETFTVSAMKDVLPEAGAEIHRRREG